MLIQATLQCKYLTKTIILVMSRGRCMSYKHEASCVLAAFDDTVTAARNKSKLHRQ